MVGRARLASNLVKPQQSKFYQMKATADIGEVAFEIYKILKDIASEERARIIKATVVLLGDELSHVPVIPGKEELSKKEKASVVGDSVDESPQKFLTTKEPANRGELLAVAARYLEKFAEKESCTRADIKKIIADARRNFDDKNFNRDMSNATFQAGFFNKGGTKGEYTLSYFGQEFVDALPDRETAKALKRPGSKKKAIKKAAVKKTTK